MLLQGPLGQRKTESADQEWQGSKAAEFRACLVFNRDALGFLLLLFFMLLGKIYYG